MQGQRPNTESLERIAKALALDVRHLMVLAGHLPPEATADAEQRAHACAAWWLGWH